MLLGGLSAGHGGDHATRRDDSGSTGASGPHAAREYAILDRRGPCRICRDQHAGRHPARNRRAAVEA